MHRRPGMALCSVLLSLLLAGVGSSSRAAAENLPPPKPTGKQVIVPINATEHLQSSSRRRISQVVNEKETVARVAPVPGDPTSVIITGLDTGITHVTLTDEAGGTDYLDVIVQFDIEYLRSLLRRAVPTANVEPIPAANNTVILTGYVAHAEDIDTILRTARSVVLGDDRIINALRVGGVQQVQLCVVVARVNRSLLRQMGFAFYEAGKNHKIDSTFNSSYSASAQATPIFPTEANALASSNGNIVLGLLNQNQAFLGFLNALRNEGVAKILSEPRLVALSGRPASFLDGGEQAIPVPAGLGQIGVQFEEFGTRLNFLPIVLGNGRIHLEVEPEVSTLVQQGSVNIGGAAVLGRATQRVHTTVEMEDGQTLLIGGLIQNVNNATATKIPILGDLPYVGAAFRTISYDENEIELVVMVTPHLVDPMSCDQLPKYLPGQETRPADECELFLEGILEAPRGPREVCPGGHYVPAYKHSPTAGQFPCGPGVCGPEGCEGPNCGPAAEPGEFMLDHNHSALPLGAHPGEAVPPTPGTATPEALPAPSPLPEGAMRQGGPVNALAGQAQAPTPVINRTSLQVPDSAGNRGSLPN